ncbi:DMT family transporter [Deinococcus altitudinis]|uniref:DMT family transporter n=1 Tax=Deinococcus altitudinis TaxID=468914 RepID=UPI0038920567
MTFQTAADWTPFLLLAVAALLDVGANILLKRSDGFRHKLPAWGGIGLILLAFTLLSLALKTIPLGVAYAVWGGLGIVLTALVSLRLDSVRFTARGWAGLTLILGSVLLMHLGG